MNCHTVVCPGPGLDDPYDPYCRLYRDPIKMCGSLLVYVESVSYKYRITTINVHVLTMTTVQLLVFTSWNINLLIHGNALKRNAYLIDVGVSSTSDDRKGRCSLTEDPKHLLFCMHGVCT